MTTVALALAIAVALAASLAVPFLLPWEWRVRFVVSSQVPDPLTAGLATMRYPMVEAVVTAGTVRAQHVEIGIHEVHGARRVHGSG